MNREIQIGDRVYFHDSVPYGIGLSIGDEVIVSDVTQFSYIFYFKGRTWVTQKSRVRLKKGLRIIYEH